MSQLESKSNSSWVNCQPYFSGQRYVCSIEAKLEFRINCSKPTFLSLRKKLATLVSKNHTRKKCDSLVNNIIRAVALLLLCYMHRRAEDKDSIVRDNVLLVCVFELLTFSPDLRVYKSDTDTPPLPDPPDILPFQPGASRTDKIYYFSCISPSPPLQGGPTGLHTVKLKYYICCLTDVIVKIERDL